MLYKIEGGIDLSFIRKVANSDLLSSVMDIPEPLKNKKVEILVLPYEDPIKEDAKDQKPVRVRGLLEKYKDKTLQAQEAGAWARAVVDKHEDSRC